MRQAVHRQSTIMIWWPAYKTTMLSHISLTAQSNFAVAGLSFWPMLLSEMSVYCHGTKPASRPPAKDRVGLFQGGQAASLEWFLKVSCSPPAAGCSRCLLETQMNEVFAKYAVNNYSRTHQVCASQLSTAKSKQWRKWACWQWCNWTIQASVGEILPHASTRAEQLELGGCESYPAAYLSNRSATWVKWRTKI